MKLNLNLYYDCFQSDLDNFKHIEINAKTRDYETDYELVFKSVVVEIPDDIGLTEQEYKKAYHLKHLSAAEKDVMEKRDALTRAEEVVKNMLALEVDVS